MSIWHHGRVWLNSGLHCCAVHSVASLLMRGFRAFNGFLKSMLLRNLAEPFLRIRDQQRFLFLLLEGYFRGHLHSFLGPPNVTSAIRSGSVFIWEHNVSAAQQWDDHRSWTVLDHVGVDAIGTVLFSLERFIRSIPCRAFGGTGGNFFADTITVRFGVFVDAIDTTSSPLMIVYVATTTISTTTTTWRRCRNRWVGRTNRAVLLLNAEFLLVLLISGIPIINRPVNYAGLLKLIF